MAIAQVWSRPVATAVTGASAARAARRGRRPRGRSASPSPIWPWSLAPQQASVPSVVAARTRAAIAPRALDARAQAGDDRRAVPRPPRRRRPAGRCCRRPSSARPWSASTAHEKSLPAGDAPVASGHARRPAGAGRDRRRRVAELAGVVGAPAEDGAAGGDGAGVRVAGRDRRDVVRSRDADGERARRARAVAELAVDRCGPSTRGCRRRARRQACPPPALTVRDRVAPRTSPARRASASPPARWT